MNLTQPTWPTCVKPRTRFIVYGLIDPSWNTLRYIGKSVGGLKRSRVHAWYARKRDPRCDLRHCYRWIRQLQTLDLKYKIVVLEAVDEADFLGIHEQWWIAFARAWGCKLTNLTLGGDGATGHKKTPEMRAKISAVLANPDVKARQSAGIRAALADPDVKEHRRMTWSDPDVKARHCAAVRLALSDPAAKERRRIAEARHGRDAAATYRRLIEAMPTATNVEIHAEVVVVLGIVRAGSVSRVRRHRWELRQRARKLEVGFTDGAAATLRAEEFTR